MPVLKNPRHERFAQGIAKGKSHFDAYAYAGFATSTDKDGTRSNAGKVAKRPEVEARVTELQAKQAKRIGITVDDLVSELQDMLALAKRVKHPAAGVGAILAKGKLLGLVVDRAEIEGTIRKPSAQATDRTSMTMDEWEKKYAPGVVTPAPDKLQ